MTWLDIEDLLAGLAVLLIGGGVAGLYGQYVAAIVVGTILLVIAGLAARAA